MTINEICELLKKELLGTGYEYGFFLNGKTYKPDTANGFDRRFFKLLLTEYRIQNPDDTKASKVGTCNDIVVLMKSILDKYNVPCKIWLLHDTEHGKFHTILTFECENKTVYLELTPQTARANYGKEIIFEDEQSFVKQYSKNGCKATDITDFIVVGEAPDFILSRM